MSACLGAVEQSRAWPTLPWARLIAFAALAVLGAVALAWWWSPLYWRPKSSTGKQWRNEILPQQPQSDERQHCAASNKLDGTVGQEGEGSD
jgi:hypothetical protein